MQPRIAQPLEFGNHRSGDRFRSAGGSVCVHVAGRWFPRSLGPCGRAPWKLSPWRRWRAATLWRVSVARVGYLPWVVFLLRAIVVGSGDVRSSTAARAGGSPKFRSAPRPDLADAYDGFVAAVTPVSDGDAAIPPAVLMAAFAAVDRAAILTDPQGRVRLANHACARLLGRAPRSLVGADAGDLMQVDGRERKLGWFVVPLPSGGPTHGWSLVVTGSAPDESDATAWSTTSTGGQPSQTDWATILALLSRVHPAATLPETSQLICDAVRETTDLDGAMIILMPENSDFVHVSNSGPELPGFSTGSTFPLENVAPIMEITARGPWYLRSIRSRNAIADRL